MNNGGLIVDQIIKLSQEQQERFWCIWQICQSDTGYHKMLQALKPLERKYEAVLQTLSNEQQDMICDFVSHCEGMSCGLHNFSEIKSGFWSLFREFGRFANPLKLPRLLRDDPVWVKTWVRQFSLT